MLNKMDESHRYYFEQKKPDINNCMLKEAKTVFAFSCVGRTRIQEEWPLTGKDLRDTSRALETSSALIWHVVIQVPTNVKLY